jgi:pyruvate/2-oxoglutarate dehydrogenase complex dihydrolipoamide acyltransferase (E2) component
MTVEVKLPQWGMGMTEGTLVSWLKEEGDSVAEGEDLAEIETAKAQDVMVSPAAGVLSKICIQVDETVPVGDVLALIEPAG